jgi:hypothetical protein
MTAYLTFYAAEMWELEASGILSLVALGLYMTKVGKTTISQNSEETLHHVWQYLGFISETLVFLLAGVIIAVKVFREDNDIHWDDYLKNLALYVLLHIIRFAMIFLVRWPMSKIGYGLSWSQATVLGYAGLRGAVSLILALIVYLDDGIDQETSDLVIFHTSGIAILTLVINGTTTGFLIRKLGLTRMTNVKKKMLRNLIVAYKKQVREEIEEMKVKKNYSKIDWEIIKDFAASDKIRDDIFKHRNIKKEERDMVASSNIGEDDILFDYNNYSKEELYLETKHRYLSTLKGIYWEFFTKGYCSARSCLLLIESANRAIDHADDSLKDYKFLETYFDAGLVWKCLIKLKRNCLIKPFIKGYLYHNISFVYDVTVNYVEAHEECIEMIHDIINNQDILNELKGEVYNEIKRAEHKLYHELEENFPEVIQAVQHKRGGYYLVNAMRNFVNEMIEHGQIDFKEAKFFLHRLNKSDRNLQLNKLKVKFEEPTLDFQSHCELAKMFSKDQIDQLSDSFSEHTFADGEYIIKRDEIFNSLFYISKGVVIEKNGAIDDLDAPGMKNTAGDIVGLQFITKDEGRSFTNLYAKTVCSCISIPISSLISLIQTTEQRDRIWRYIGPSLIRLNPEKFDRFQDLDPYQMKTVLKNSEYSDLQEQEKVEFPNGGILFEGEMEIYNEKDHNEADINYNELDDGVGRRVIKVKSYAFIRPNPYTYMCRTTCCIYKFPESLRDPLMSYNNQLFVDAFNTLRGAQGSIAKGTLRSKQDTLMKKQKTMLLGLPKNIAHIDPYQTFSAHKGRRQSIVAPQSSDGLPEGLFTNYGQNTIMPKGFKRTTTEGASLYRRDTIENKMTGLNKEEERNKTKGILKLENSKESDFSEEDESKEESESSSGNYSHPKSAVRVNDVNLNIKIPTAEAFSSSADQNEPLDEEDEEEPESSYESHKNSINKR